MAANKRDQKVYADPILVRLRTEQVDYLRDYADRHTGGNVTQAIRDLMMIGQHTVQSRGCELHEHGDGEVAA